MLTLYRTFILYAAHTARALRPSTLLLLERTGTAYLDGVEVALSISVCHRYSHGRRRQRSGSRSGSRSRRRNSYGNDCLSAEVDAAVSESGERAARHVYQYWVKAKMLFMLLQDHLHPLWLKGEKKAHSSRLSESPSVLWDWRVGRAGVEVST